LPAGDGDGAHGSVDGQLDQLTLEGPIEVPLIVWHVLEIPSELAGIGIDGDGGVGVEAVVGDAGFG